MAANQNKILSGGKADGLIKRVTAARTGVTTIASPADATDLRLIFEAGTNGGFVDEVGYRFVGTGTQAATLVYVWLTDTSNANAEIIHSFTVAAGSAMSNTVPGQTNKLNPSFWNLASGRKVYVSVSVLSTNCECVVWALGGQFEAQ
jgi:hypothetical protein